MELSNAVECAPLRVGMKGAIIALAAANKYAYTANRGAVPKERYPKGGNRQDPPRMIHTPRR